MPEERVTGMKKRTAERVAKVSDVGFAKFLSLFHSLEGGISLSVGEPDFPTPWHICEASVEAMKKGITTYTPTAGFPELREAVARHLEKLYGIKYDPKTEIVITVGASQAMDLAFRTILDPGDEVIMPDPYYVCYPSCIVLSHGVPVTVPTRPDNDFKLEADRIEAKITPKTKVILFGYPANPTGTELTREEYAEIARVAEKHDLLVISDEIYSRLTYDVEHTCFPTLPGMKERTILLDGFSKAYAMTGWRLGYAAGPAEIMAAISKVHQHTMLSPSSMAQLAALEALKSGEEDVQRMLAEYSRRRKVIVRGLNDIGLKCHEPKGAFYAFPSVQVTGMTSDEFTENLLKEEKVIVMPGSLFGRQGEGYVRCCYATSLSDIEEALRRMARFVERHRAHP
ncbi:MAG: aminotransferase class I/II-fold pyridoxal phosphate-dependent enzyme [Chloroflexota bacterium]|nr:aminotransferase class I/II-fold pyridoxal phosphate-dependent enzyme [Chloroflexota bacterium]